MTTVGQPDEKPTGRTLFRSPNWPGQPLRRRAVGAVLVLRDADDPRLLPLLLAHRGRPRATEGDRDWHRRRLQRARSSESSVRSRLSRVWSSRARAPDQPRDGGRALTIAAPVRRANTHSVNTQRPRQAGAIITAGRASKRTHAMKKLAALLLTSTAMAVAPVAVAPVAQADICAGAHGRHFAAGGCTNIAGDVATGAAIAAATDPYVPGEIPCYTVEGVPYYTPPGDPC